MTNTRPDHHSAITQNIITQLEAGVRPWQCPWSVRHQAGPVSRPLRGTGQPYQGINVLVLWLTAFERGLSAPIWLTFNQAKDLGGFVRKGEKSTTVVYANSIEKTETDNDTGEESKTRIPFLKSYCVFNVDQIEGLPGQFYAREQTSLNMAERLENAERFFAATQIETRFGGNKAFYSPSLDRIQLPPYDSFQCREQFYSTLAHETIHAVGSEKRLNRTFGKRFGDQAYSFEELIAELGAAFLCADLGITAEVLPDHAQYLSHWLKILKADKKAIFTAASQASRAVEYLHSLQPVPATV